jgi:hypothetical protein
MGSIEEKGQGSKISRYCPLENENKNLTKAALYFSSRNAFADVYSKMGLDLHFSTGRSDISTTFFAIYTTHIYVRYFSSSANYSRAILKF